jgi:O-antigen/teichoic acid export membrane protein
MKLLGLVPEAGAVAAGQIVAALASVASIRALTGLLRPEAFGEMAIAFTAAALGQQLVLGPIAMACIRYYAPSQEGGLLTQFVRCTAMLTGAGILALAAIAGAAWFGLRAEGLSAWIPSLWAATAYAWLSSVSSLLDGVQNAARQRKIVAMHQGLGGWLRLALVVIAARIWGGSCNGTLWGYSAGYAILIVSQTFFFLRTAAAEKSDEKSAAMRPLILSMCNYAWPFSAWGIFTWVQCSADRWALGAYAGLYQTGLYQSIYQLGYYPASLMTQFLLQVATPILFAKAGEANVAARRESAERWNHRLMLIVLGATLAGALFSFAGGRHLLALLVAPAYRGESSLVTWLLLASGCFAAGQIGSLNLMISMNTRRLIAPKIVTAIAGTLLIVAGARAAGTAGVVAAQLCFSLGYLIWILHLKRKTREFGVAPSPAYQG